MAVAKSFPPEKCLVKVSQPNATLPVYQITFAAPPDNRLNTSFCNALFSALDYVATLPPGAVITTSEQAKFYSNGLDLQHVHETPGFLQGTLYNLFIRLLTFPMPTVAAVTGHAFAGGWMLAMCHDYRVGNEKKGWFSLNELEFGGMSVVR
ncbi:Enoyl-CoA delta isomerase 1, peroxisomal [Neolecta irregularis DAH-3]|uniref:Enoyl-CoA delta isomerase 1, peroxisomal n=1 Tax=Neolecta irregularis (strain DAH-3) TaxID=1198029 RepID=A0A1U7LMP6_NEOID|nr:Enoyl-CoA delta isomerase 1, peroxisomal [Neolecta irregularis DAH-3]|eukprot:OLL23853.1 Enoyl-CoA delta isomerase 1, peroxisomal [Neolecta irregularis DAH-3]